jgi:glucan biosynthesis protein C
LDERQPGLDALRVGLILLGIPFHAALPYADGALGLIHADRSSSAVAVVVVLLRTLRMPAFFLVSGFFAARLLAKRPADVWLRDRLVRLVIPFAAALVTIVPLQRAITGAYRGATGILVDAPQPSFHHLWFLSVLFAFCVAVVVARPVLDRAIDAVAASVTRRLGRHTAGLGFLLLVAVAILWEIAVKAFFDAEIPPEARFAGTSRLAAVYLPWYLFGYALDRTPGAMTRFAEPSPSTLMLAGLFLAIDLAVAGVPNLESFSALHLAAWTGSAWYVARAAVAATARLSFASAPLVRRLGDWTMPIYLLHHPWTLAIAFLLLPTHWPAELQFVLVTILATAATFASCAVVDRAPVLAILLNGRRLPPLPFGKRAAAAVDGVKAPA